jgi:predicted nuclease of predicted toxin-antitoxin system
MKIILDECTPLILKRLLSGFDIVTVQELGWTGVKNGELLARAEEQFDVLVTTDKNLRYQQNLSSRKIAIIELPTNQVPTVAELASAVQEALATIAPGDFVEIPLP